MTKKKHFDFYFEKIIKHTVISFSDELLLTWEFVDNDTVVGETFE